MDLNKFSEMTDAVGHSRTAPRFFGSTRPTAIYVCTICGKVNPPTTDVNIRCGRCKAPLMKSMERVQRLQAEIKRVYMYPDMVDDIRQRIRTIREMKREFLDLDKAPNIRKDLKQTVTRRASSKPKHILPVILVYEVMINPCEQHPKGFKGLMEVPESQRVSFVRKAKKIKCHIELKGTRKDMQRMEEIRRAVVSVINDGRKNK